MKGLSLSLNAVIIVAIAMLALTSLGWLLLSGSFGQMSEADAQRVFSTGCARYCEPNLYQTFKNAYLASKNDKDFVAACKRLKYGDEQYVNRCFERCANCNLDVTEEDINRGYDNLIALTERR